MKRVAVYLCVVWSMVATAQVPDITLKVPRLATFVVYGDTRFTNPADHTRSNPDVRQALVQQIAAEEPAAIVFTGDIVLNGDTANWRVYEEETSRWRARKIPVLPALGNHDVYGEDALSHFFSEFPQLGNKRWHSVRAGNVLFLLLDSNVDDSQGSEQGRWLDAQLSHVPADVDFVLLAMHHPVYTHSIFSLFGGGHSARESEQHLGALLEARQQTLHARLLVFSGHIHNYERYEHGGVTYVVTGGGGAPPYPILRSSENPLSGLNYHYCRIRVNGPKLSLEMVRLETNEAGYTTHVRDEFQVTAGGSGAASH